MIHTDTSLHAMPVVADRRLYVAGGGDIWWGKREAWLHGLNPAAGAGDVTDSARLWTYPLLCWTGRSADRLSPPTARFMCRPNGASTR
ncbi:MAG TPA: hypothetical protein P5111_11240 [Kiritimatiellia bacterium]|nr:hypothetical protein [Kiritimatiellia bacterium]